MTTEINRPMPDFSDGDEFLARLRSNLGRRQRRRHWAAALSSVAAAVLLTMASFGALQEQQYRDIWDGYLLSEMTYTDVEASKIADAEIYLALLLEEEDLDELLYGIYALGLEEELIFATYE